MTISSSQQKIRQNLGFVLFLGGVLLIAALSILAVLADYEATFYGFKSLGDEHLPSLRCPVLLTPRQPGLIEASFTNPGEKPVELIVYASFSGPLISNERISITLDARETKKLSWTVDSQNVDLQMFVLAQVGHYAARLIPFQRATCGMVMINLPFLSGKQLFALWFTLGLLSLFIGMSLWYLNNRPVDGREWGIYQYMRFLSVITLFTLLIALQDWWAIGGILFVVTLLTMLSLLAIVNRN